MYVLYAPTDKDTFSFHFSVAITLWLIYNFLRDLSVPECLIGHIMNWTSKCKASHPCNGSLSLVFFGGEKNAQILV